jgi:hypothetical protein
VSKPANSKWVDAMPGFFEPGALLSFFCASGFLKSTLEQIGNGLLASRIGLTDCFDYLSSI